jgi:hypothetical protein
MIGDRGMEALARLRIQAEKQRATAARLENPARAAEHEARAIAFEQAELILLGAMRGSVFDEGSGLPVAPPREPVDEEWLGLTLRLPELAEQARPRAFTVNYAATRMPAAELEAAEAELRRSCARHSIIGAFAGQIKFGPDFDASLWAAEFTDAGNDGQDTPV